MSKWLGICLICLIIASAVGQTPSSKYQVGTITAVSPHQNGPGESDSAARYDVTVQVANTSYIVLYAPPNGANTVEYSAGFNVPVLVGEKTLTFNSKLSGTTEVPILSQTALPTQPAIDLSKVPSQYFSMKMQHLTEVLNLSDQQQTQIKPIVEQETGEVGQIVGNPVLSTKDKLNRFQKIVKSSDEKIKPLLSQDQVAKLLSLRKEQKDKVKQYLANQKTTSQS
jgi:hypothetical protein